MSPEPESPPQRSANHAVTAQLGTDTLPPATEKSDVTTIDLVGFSPTQMDLAPETSGKIDERELTRRRVRRWLVVWGLLAFGSLSLLAVPKFYHTFNVWCATQFALQGEEFIRKKQIEEALPPIRAAYTLSPLTPEVLRASAQLLTTFGSPEATNYWIWLLKTPDATDDDRRAAINCALQYGLYNKASTMIQDLLARNSGDSRNELLAARWSAARGTPPQTMLYVTRAVKDDPTNKAALDFLAAQEFANPYLHQEGVDFLFQLADSNDESGLTAMHVLSLDTNLKPAEIDRLIARLHSHPLAGELERVGALELEIRRHPDQRERLIDQAEIAFKTAPPPDQATFAEWLINNNEARRVLKLISRERALSNESLCFAYLDCLAKLKRWSDIKVLLSGATIPLETPLVELYLSNCAHEMGGDQAAELHWQNAVAAAAYDPAQSLRLAMYAEDHGQNERAAVVYRALTQDPLVALVAYQGLLRVSLDQDTRHLRDLLDTMVSRWPNEPKMASQDIFLNLLLNARVPEMHRRAVGLLAEDSNNLALRTNVAFSCLRLNDPAGALRVYEDADIDWGTVPVNDLVIYAAVLNANGRGTDAHRLLFLIKRHVLRPELREFIKSIP